MTRLNSNNYPPNLSISTHKRVSSSSLDVMARSAVISYSLETHMLNVLIVDTLAHGLGFIKPLAAAWTTHRVLSSFHEELLF